MPRNREEARKRLQRAALELFAENGFDHTTAAQIAARAGVTERTFFRHFPDKREVLFDGQNVLGAALSDAIGAAPAKLLPMQALQRAFTSVTPMLEQNRPFSEPRQRIIAATPALQEREVAKHVALISGGGRGVATAGCRKASRRPCRSGRACGLQLGAQSLVRGFVIGTGRLSRPCLRGTAHALRADRASLISGRGRCRPSPSGRPSRSRCACPNAARPPRLR